MEFLDEIFDYMGEDDYLFEEVIEEPILEINIYKDDGICISVDPSENRSYGDIAYFKVYNNTDPKKATKEVRLHFTDSGYEEHTGKELWKMNSKEKKKLVNALNKPVRVQNKNHNLTWDALIYTFNKGVKEEDKLNTSIDIPEY